MGQHLDSRITTSTLGMGLGYDESLLSAIARAGSGNEHFAEEADTAAGVIVQECGDLLSQRFLSCRLTVTMGVGHGVRRGAQRGDPAALSRTASRSSSADSSPSRSARSCCGSQPKQASRPGRRKVAMLRLDYVLADDLSEHSVSTSVWARVARDDERDAVVDADVMAEVLFQRVQRRKRAGMQALSMGDYDRGGAHPRRRRCGSSSATGPPSRARAGRVRRRDRLHRRD